MVMCRIRAASKNENFIVKILSARGQLRWGLTFYYVEMDIPATYKEIGNVGIAAKVMKVGQNVQKIIL